MTPPRVLIAGGLVAIVVIAVIVGVNAKGDAPAPPAPTPGSVATLPAGPTGQPGSTTSPSTLETAPTTGPSTVPPEPALTAGDDEQPIAGLLSTLSVDEEAAAAAFADQVAAALTTQDPDETRRARQARLAPFFVTDSPDARQVGPVPGAVVQPKSVDWAKWADGGQGELARVVTIRYGRSIDGAYAEGTVTWQVQMVRAGTGWLASAVELGATTG